jgi:hypothetical protein
MDGRIQHDAHELNRLLIDALEKTLKYTSGEDLCKLLYKGIYLTIYLSIYLSIYLTLY